jgi:hypothetical protein
MESDLNRKSEKYEETILLENNKIMGNEVETQT